MEQVSDIQAVGQVEIQVARLEAWLETMRTPGGYGGPVAHWWQQSLLYTGAGLDWRYEGIIKGYLQLWAGTGQRRWLQKARRAGDDLLAGQLKNGHFRASAFEINPATAGTPHEAACDIGLLRLALLLRDSAESGWEDYAAAAEHNLRRFYIDQLWDPARRSFRDHPLYPSFVPNKAATACQAFFLLAELRQEASWVETFVLPTLERILEYQVSESSRLLGAIAQNSFGASGQPVEKYFPIYIARCIPALLQGYQWTNQERYLASALRAMSFIVRWTNGDGTVPTVIYANQQVNHYPSWIAPLGDILSAAQALRPYGLESNHHEIEKLSATHKRLLAGQDASGGFQTARGFAAQASWRPACPASLGGEGQGLPDVRDLLHVVGWCDKVFGYLTSLVRSKIPLIELSPVFETECTFKKINMLFRETPELLEIKEIKEIKAGREANDTLPAEVCYRWRKGQSWPEVAAPEFWLR